MMNKNKLLEKKKLSLQKSSKKESSNRTSGAKPTRNCSKPGEEMKSIMKEWHRPVYHSSSFTLVPSVQTIDESEDDSKTMCRICQAVDDSVSNQQVTPCGCIGSMQYVHMNCLRQWRLMQKAKGVDVSFCELCKKPYNIKLLGETDVPTDNLLKMQEDLKRLVRSGIYLMLLVKSWKEDLATLHQSRQSSDVNTNVSANSSSSSALSSNIRHSDLTLENIERLSNETLSNYNITLP